MDIFNQVFEFIFDLLFNQMTITIGKYDFSLTSVIVGGFILGGFLLIVRVVFSLRGGDDD